MSAITRIITKTRALVDDLEKTTTESNIYTSSSIFTLGETGNSIVSVEINGVASSDYTFSTTTNKVTITANLTANDTVVIQYKYYSQFSDTEIKGYVEGALTYISLYGIKNFYLESALRLYPYPTEKEENLISLITAILIKPNYSRYRTATVSVEYPRNKSKEEKITEAIGYYKHSDSHGIFFGA